MQHLQILLTFFLSLSFLSVMYKQETLSDDPVIFLDPNSLSEDGTVSLATTAFSEDGKTFAYGLSKSGSDWYDVHFKNVETGENYPEVLKKVSEARQATRIGKKLAD
jgi:protease II